MGEPESKCPQCEYSFPGYQTEEEYMDAAPYYCYYIGVTGHRRPCPPGDACTVFMPRTPKEPGAVWRKTSKDVKKARLPRRGTPKLPPEAFEKARALLLAGEEAKEVAAQVGISRTKVYEIRNELIDQGKMERPEQARTQYYIRTIWPKKEVFRGNFKECAAFLGVKESYIRPAIYRGQVIQGKYLAARVKDNTTDERGN